MIISVKMLQSLIKSGRFVKGGDK